MWNKTLFIKYAWITILSYNCTKVQSWTIMAISVQFWNEAKIEFICHHRLRIENIFPTPQKHSNATFLNKRVYIYFALHSAAIHKAISCPLITALCTMTMRRTFKYLCIQSFSWILILLQFLKILHTFLTSITRKWVLVMHDSVR